MKTHILDALILLLSAFVICATAYTAYGKEASVIACWSIIFVTNALLVLLNIITNRKF